SNSTIHAELLFGNAGVIYYTLFHNSVPWREAQETDTHYRTYLSYCKKSKSFPPIDSLAPGPRCLLRSMLQPDPQKRPTIAELLALDFVRLVDVCAPGKPAIAHSHQPVTGLPPGMGSVPVLGGEIEGSGRSALRHTGFEQ
ncbi:serine/threonine-protein kinase HAL4/sat4, partial [Gonapodya sp. JEL0774]